MGFNIGDRVVCTTRVDGFDDTAGKLGTVVSLLSSPHLCGVEFDEDIGEHDCNGRGTYGHCLWVSPHFLLLVRLINTKKASEREFITLQGNEVA